MHAQSIVQRFVLTHLQGMHAARRGVFAEAVWAAIAELDGLRRGFAYTRRRCTAM